MNLLLCVKCASLERLHKVLTVRTVAFDWLLKKPRLISEAEINIAYSIVSKCLLLYESMASNEKNTNSEHKSARKAYSREFKLNVVSWFFNNGKKVNLTAGNFKIDKKQIRMWVRAEQKIRNQNPHSKSSGRRRQPFFPSLEKDLHDEFKTMRREGKIVKRWWFNIRMIQLVKERNP